MNVFLGLKGHERLLNGYAEKKKKRGKIQKFISVKIVKLQAKTKTAKSTWYIRMIKHNTIVHFNLFSFIFPPEKEKLGWKPL